MRKIMSLALAIVMSLSVSTVAFGAVVTKQLGYNVVVNGDKSTFAYGEAINVDGATMITADAFAAKFASAGITAADVTKLGNPFVYEGNEYYALRDVANGNALNVYWDKATNTALVINGNTYEEIKRLMDASTEKSYELKNCDVEMLGNVSIALSLGEQIPDINMAIPLEANIKLDMKAPYMEMDFNVTVEGNSLEAKMYDDGINSYVYESETGVWQKTESALADSLAMYDQIMAMNPSSSYVDPLSVAGLKMTKSGDTVTLEGDMYVSELYEELDINSLLKEAMATAGAEGMDMNINMPNTMYVKYVMDTEGNIKEMALKYDMSMTVSAEGETIQANIIADITMPKFVINSDFSTVIPEDVKASAITAE